MQHVRTEDVSVMKVSMEMDLLVESLRPQLQISPLLARHKKQIHHVTTARRMGNAWITFVCARQDLKAGRGHV